MTVYIFRDHDNNLCSTPDVTVAELFGVIATTEYDDYTPNSDKYIFENNEVMLNSTPEVVVSPKDTVLANLAALPLWVQAYLSPAITVALQQYEAGNYIDCRDIILNFPILVEIKDREGNVIDVDTYRQNILTTLNI